MEFESIHFDIANGAARITLNRPDRLNALSIQMLDELQRALRIVADRPDEVRAVLVTGAGRGFSSGADLSIAPPEDRDDPKDALRDYCVPACRMLKSLSVPTVAAVNGACAGAGLGIAFACDLVVAARSAYFLSAFINVARIPDAGVSWHLPNVLGEQRAAAMMLLGEKLPAEDAADWGLVWRCVEDAELAPFCDTLLQKLAGGPTRAYRRTKELLRSARTASQEAQMQLEIELQAEMRASEDAQEARKAFMEKRPPNFRGR